MRNNRFRRLPPWTACCLCLLVAALAGCGDYCLFCDGQGGGGGGNGTATGCENPFPGLGTFPLLFQDAIVDTFIQEAEQEDRLSLAVIPEGMSFTYPPSVDNRTADPGDVILADQQANSIFIYEFDATQARRTLLTGHDQVSGLALLHVEVNDTTAYDLMFFTVNTDNTLYIYDLTGTSPTSLVLNPVPITNLLAGSGFFESPTALAVTADTEKATIFIVNDSGNRSSVRRLSINLVNWYDFESPRTLATMSRSDFRLVDLAYFSQTDTLFVSKKLIDGVGGWVYEISNASDTTRTVNLDTAGFFIQRAQRVTGLEVAPTNKEGTAADLLLLKENLNQDQVEQYDTAQGGEFPEVAYTPSADFDFMQAIEYDCTNRRLVMTNVPFNDAIARDFFEAFPSQ